jgi:hypothetical protein
MIESAPHVPPAAESVRAMHLLLTGLQPTWCPTSHSSCPMHESPIWPAFGVTQVFFATTHTVWLLALHDFWMHVLPGLVIG